MVDAAASKRFLITGATGFVGGALANALLYAGAEVRVLVRSRDRAGALLKAGAEVVEGALDSDAAAAACEGVDVLIHCAARASDTGDIADFRRDNVEGALSLLRHAQAHGVKRFVHLSTISTYGYDPPPHVDEDTPTPDIPDYPYAQSKIEAEAALKKLTADGETELVVARVGSVYGPGSYHWTERPIRLLSGPTGMLLVNGGGGLHNYIYIENLVDVLILCATVPEAAGETFNLVEGTTTYREYWQRYADMLGRGKFRELKKGTALFLARLVELGATLRGKEPLVTRIAIRLLCRTPTMSSEKARRVLGWEPKVSYDEGMKRSEAWLRAQGLLG